MKMINTSHSFLQGFTCAEPSRSRNLVSLKQAVLSLCILFTITSFAQKKWTLQECINYALENNISIKQAELDTEASKEGIVSAKGNFLPSVSGSASQNFNFGSYIDISGSRVSRASRGNSFSLGTGVTLFNGFRNTNTYSQAKLGLEMSKQQLAILKSDISLNIANIYLRVLNNKEQLKIAEESITISQEKINQLQELLTSGARAKSELLEAQAQLASDKERLVNAENNVELSLLSIAQLLQIPHSNFDIQGIAVDVSSFELLYNNTDAIYNQAVTTRPEIKNAELVIKDSELSIKIAKSAFLPSLNFSAGLGTSYQHNQGQKDIRPLVDPNDPNNIIYVSNGFLEQLDNNLGKNFGFGLSIPIFSRGQNKSNVNRAIINNKKRIYNLESQKQTLRINIEQAYADAKASLNQFKASQASIIAQEEAYKNAQERYNLDIMTSLEMEQVKNRYLNAQSSLVIAKYDFIFKTKVLDFYMGKSLID